jgi:hypothetical protein
VTGVIVEETAEQKKVHEKLVYNIWHCYHILSTNFFQSPGIDVSIDPFRLRITPRNRIGPLTPPVMDMPSRIHSDAGHRKVMCAWNNWAQKVFMMCYPIGP